VTALGVGGLYAAVLVEKFVPMGVNLIRFQSDRWQAVSRQYRPGETDSDGAGG
jgi:Na+-driven multidrug efflux pump